MGLINDSGNMDYRQLAEGKFRFYSFFTAVISNGHMAAGYYGTQGFFQLGDIINAFLTDYGDNIPGFYPGLVSGRRWRYRTYQNTENGRFSRFPGGAAGISYFHPEFGSLSVAPRGDKLLQSRTVETDNRLTVDNDYRHPHLTGQLYHFAGGITIPGYIILGVFDPKFAKKTLGLVTVTTGWCGVYLNVHYSLSTAVQDLLSFSSFTLDILGSFNGLVLRFGSFRLIIEL